MLPNILRDFTVFYESVGKLGTGDSFKLPMLKQKKEAHIGGGMSGEIQIRYMQHDPLEAELHLISFDTDVISTFGGTAPGEIVKLQVRGVLQSEDDTNIKGVIAHLRCKCDVEPEEWKPAGKSGLTIPLDVYHYRLLVDNVEVLELDPTAYVWKTKGIDRLAAYRQALGI